MSSKSIDPFWFVWNCIETTWNVWWAPPLARVRFQGGRPPTHADRGVTRSDPFHLGAARVYSADELLPVAAARTVVPPPDSQCVQFPRVVCVARELLMVPNAFVGCPLGLSGLIRKGQRNEMGRPPHPHTHTVGLVTVVTRTVGSIVEPSSYASRWAQFEDVPLHSVTQRPTWVTGRIFRVDFRFLSDWRRPARNPPQPYE